MAYYKQDYLVAGLCLYEIDRVYKQFTSAYLPLIHAGMKRKHKKWNDVQTLVFQYYICKNRPADEMLSPPPAV